MAYLLLIAGLAALIFSGELLVRGAVGAALRFRISPLVIGMTLVSFGTSAPELLVSVQAALNGHPDISIGNVIGSNVANITLVLGLTAIIFPIPVDRNSIRIDWPVMMFSSILLYLAIFNTLFAFWEGLGFMVLLMIFVIWLIRKSRKEEVNSNNDTEEAIEKAGGGIVKNIVLVIVGCAGLVFAAQWFLDGAVQIATDFGLSDRVIGITLIAFGTSLPELIISGVAAIKKQTAISIGNLLGSNIFNILGIIGVTGIITDIPISEEVINFDIFWVLGAALLLLPLMIIKRIISRMDGFLLLLVYIIYMFFLL